MRVRNAGPPDWFPLPIYQQTLTKNEWLTEIALRAAVQTADNNRRAGKSSRLNYEGSALDTFRSLFVTRKSGARGNVAEAQANNFWPIREPTAFELFFLAENQRVPGQNEAEAWARRLNEDGKTTIVEFISSGAMEQMAAMGRDFAKEPPAENYLDVLGRRAPVMVDLDHDDQTLELAFKVWLAGARGVLNQKAPHSVGDKETAKWAKFGLLSAFDLLFWSHAADQPYTDAYVASLIWPDTGDEFVDLTERFRKVTRPMVQEVFAWDYVNRFWRQMELENSLDMVVARDKADRANRSAGSRAAPKDAH